MVAESTPIFDVFLRCVRPEEPIDCGRASELLASRMGDYLPVGERLVSSLELVLAPGAGYDLPVGRCGSSSHTNRYHKAWSIAQAPAR